MNDRIADRGVTVGYEPSEGEPVADIVFVHGLQGHPYRTWATTNLCSPSATGSRSLSRLRDKISRLATKSAEAEAQPQDGVLDPHSEGEPPSSSQCRFVFWPVDLLPQECPKSRVLLYGYDTKVTRLTAGAPDRGSTFSHGKDLLFALERARTPGRPLIFVAHSLGGIVVKEMLSSSDAAGEAGLKDIVESTEAIIFLGTPHRGSPELVAFAEWGRLAVRSLLFESSWTIMDTLGRKTKDLERTQELFSRLWQTYEFQVKSFQEGLGLTGLNIGSMGKKVVPDDSSAIGDQRERAETIWANHMEMCRFARSDDPGYRRVVGELRSVYLSIHEPRSPTIVPMRRCGPTMPSTPSASEITLTAGNRGRDRSDSLRACLRALWFPEITQRYQDVDNPAEETCRWIFEWRGPQGPRNTGFRCPEFKKWFAGDDEPTHYGLLWIRGCPGSGKSVLMKELHRRIAARETSSLFPNGGRDRLGGYCTAAYFFNAKGNELARSSGGLFRSLLYQLLPFHTEYFKEFYRIWAARLREWNEGGAPMQEAELRNALRDMFKHKSAKRTYIFVDAIDECGTVENVRSQAYFWRELTQTAHGTGVRLSVCLSSRHFPTISISNCPSITLDDRNGQDIKLFVEKRIKDGIADVPRRKRLIASIVEKCHGIFLWAALVVDDICRMWDEGKNMHYLVKYLRRLPEELHDLFADILASSKEEERALATRLFHWAILTTKPLRLREWHHIMAFIKQPAPLSLQEWRQSDEFTEDDEQLIKQIRNISRGLVEVRSRQDETGYDAPETTSTRAGAGSLSLESGETRVVQVIHESVREFFLESKHAENSFERTGHVSIIMTCLDYLDISELDDLVNARIEADRVLGPLSGESRTSWSTGSEDKSSARGRIVGPRSAPIQTTPVSVFRALRASGEPTPYMDIMQWLNTIQIPAHQPSQADVHTRSDEHTHVLEDYPALLSYATSKLFSHARLAEACGADPAPVVLRMSPPAVWNRWVVLREDIPLGTKLLHYVAYHDLHSWVQEMGGEQEVESWRARQPGANKRVHRRRSVASFSSASSHIESYASHRSEYSQGSEGSE